MLDQPGSLDPESAFARPDEKEIAAAITMTTSVSQSRQIVIQTYLPRDASAQEFHGLLDKMARASDRQEAMAQLESIKANLELEETQLKNLVDDFNSIETRAAAAWTAAGKKGDPKLSANEQARKDQSVTNIKRFREAIAKRKVELAKCEAVIARVD